MFIFNSENNREAKARLGRFCYINRAIIRGKAFHKLYNQIYLKKVSHDELPVKLMFN